MDRRDGIKYLGARTADITKDEIPEWKDHQPQDQDRVQDSRCGLNPAVRLVTSPAGEPHSDGEHYGNDNHQNEGHIGGEVGTRPKETG